MKRRSSSAYTDNAVNLVEKIKKLGFFRKPPCEPPKGKDILERMNDIIASNKKKQ